jgi:hypothetical protein
MSAQGRQQMARMPVLKAQLVEIAINRLSHLILNDLGHNLAGERAIVLAPFQITVAWGAPSLGFDQPQGSTPFRS